MLSEKTQKQIFKRKFRQFRIKSYRVLGIIALYAIFIFVMTR